MNTHNRHGLTVGTAPATPPGPMWDWPDAQAQAAQVGISKDELVTALKAQGHTNYNTVRDTPTIRSLIAAKSETRRGEAQPAQTTGFDEVPVGIAVSIDNFPF